MITGLGVGPNFQSPLVALQSRLKGHDIAVGTSTFGFVRNLSTSISVVLGGVIFQNQLASHASSLAQILPPEVAQSLTSSSFGSATASLGQLNAEQKRALDVAFTQSLQKIWIFYTAVSALGIVVSFFVKKKELSNEKLEVKTGLAEQERVRLEEKEEERVRREERRSGKEKDKAGHAKGDSWGSQDAERGVVEGEKREGGGS